MARTIKQVRDGWSGFEGGRQAVFFPNQWTRVGRTIRRGSRWTPTESNSAAEAYRWKLEPERPVVEDAWLWLQAQPHDGWTMTVGAGTVEFDGSLWWKQDPNPIERWLKFERTVDGVQCLVVLTVEAAADEWNRTRAVRGAIIEGHTSVDGGCFTRRGFDTSSCELVPANCAFPGEHAYLDLPTLLAAEQARCLAAASRRKTAEAVPGLPYTRQPEWFVKTASELKQGRRVTLSPHGMGTGHVLWTTRGSFGCARASAKLEERLGVTPIWVETYDHD